VTITSTNYNPANESRYARHRSIWKGSTNQLKSTVSGLSATRGVTVHQYLGRPSDLRVALNKDWRLILHSTRAAPKAGQILGHWRVEPPSSKLKQAIPTSLHSDLALIWKDFLTVAARRIGDSAGAGGGTASDDTYTGESLVVLAFGPKSFDFIVSKYGFGYERKRNHHFFQWQSRAEGFDGVVSVDDYATEERV
jgi:hypothetical protein